MAGLGPTWVLKVNLHCSKDCSDQVKKHLKKIEGVTRVHIDIQEGLVTVSGVADPSILIEAIKKAGRKAKLWKFESDPKHQEHPNLKKRYVSSDDEDVHARHYNGYGGVRYSASMPHQIPMQGGYAGNFSRPVTPYPYVRPYSYEAIHPTVYGGPPAPNPYYYPHQPTIYPHSDLSFHNSLAHYFSDDDVNVCAIL